MITHAIKGTHEDKIFQLKTWISFLEGHYKYQDEEGKKEFDISIKEMKKQLETLEEL